MKETLDVMITVYLQIANSKYVTTKMQVFINKSLRKILRIFWPDQITNNDVWLTVHRNSVWIRKTNYISLFVFFISLLIVA